MTFLLNVSHSVYAGELFCEKLISTTLSLLLSHSNPPDDPLTRSLSASPRYFPTTTLLQSLLVRFCFLLISLTQARVIQGKGIGIEESIS